jgi:small subunit ribosomal protein S6
MTRLYDLMLLIDPNAPDGRQEQVVREVQSMLEAGGTIVGSHDWGERRMAYEMDHRPEAHYHLFQFESENDLLERLQHQLKIMDGVLRFRIIRLKPGTPPPQPPRAEPPRAREQRSDDTTVAARAAADAPAEPQPAASEPEGAASEPEPASAESAAAEPQPAEPEPAAAEPEPGAQPEPAAEPESEEAPASDEAG